MAGIPVASRVLPLTQVPRAKVERLLGAHALADRAGEIITGAGYAITAGFSVDQLARLWHPHLTLSDSVKLAAQAFTRDTTRLSCCA